MNHDTTIQHPQPDSISLDVGEFVQRIVDIMAGLNNRVIAPGGWLPKFAESEPTGII